MYSLRGYIFSFHFFPSVVKENKKNENMQRKRASNNPFELCVILFLFFVRDLH